MDSRHGGNTRLLRARGGAGIDNILDFSANINPLGPPDGVQVALSAGMDTLVHYPDPDCESLVEVISSTTGAVKEEIMCGNGSSELLFLLPRALEPVSAVIPVPCYVDYAEAARSAGVPVSIVPMSPEGGFALDVNYLDSCISVGDMVFIGRPNNPTGLVADSDELRGLMNRNPKSLFVIDEAFADFVDGIERLYTNRPDNCIVSFSFTKIYAIPGLRLGCIIADGAIISRMKKLQPYWPVNCLAQEAGAAALKDPDYIRRTVEFIRREREFLAGELGLHGELTVFPGEANFLLVRINSGSRDACWLEEALIRRGIAIRNCSDYETLDSTYFRVAVRNRRENELFLKELNSVLGKQPRRNGPRRTPALMMQGTGSNAGKSVLTAAMCRILLRRGIRVAPFKAQNMSLNSYVTEDGGEMGRAQVVQAQACRLEPDVRMNPVLLKPNYDIQSQVIFMGRPVDTMDVQEYEKYKPAIFRQICDIYDSLASENDAVVIEGAGSPAEINLRKNDIVNMPIAEHAGAPVLLVGDIDRGGVFASFAGTMELLNFREREMVAGFIINRFRGEQELLYSAFPEVERRTGRPILGIVPFINGLGLPEEDSVEFQTGALDRMPRESNAVEIALVDLPHMSNFTDFDALMLEPDVRLRVVRERDELGRPDAVILPGSKNVAEDLAYLRSRSLDRAVKEMAASGAAEIIGICGGFQMLGCSISDPHGLESTDGEIQGLGILPVKTSLSADKILTRTSGIHRESGCPVRGYEIHHGITEMKDLHAVLTSKNGDIIGAGLPEQRTWGTYLHGLFDSDEFRRWFVNCLRERKGWPAKSVMTVRYDVEPAIDRLADVVEEALPVERIVRLMGL